MTPSIYGLLFVIGFFVAGGGVLLLLTSAGLSWAVALIVGCALMESTWGKP